MPGTCESSPTSTPRDWFTTTHWSVVIAAGDGPCREAEQALERLCRTYWSPLYFYVRRQGYSPEDAQDLTQGFFERVIEKKFFGKVDRAHGRFRAFLLASLKHYVSDQRDRQRAAKRGSGKLDLSWDAIAAEERYRLEPVDRTAPDKVFERQWALTVLEQALNRLRQEFVAADKIEVFDALRGLVVGQDGEPPYAELGRRLGRSETALKSMVQRVRRRYRDLIREEIAQTVSSVSEVDAEIGFLLAILSE